MIDYDLCALHRGEGIVRIHAILVFGEESGIFNFSHIMEKGSCPHQLHIGIDVGGGFTRQICHLERVLESARASRRQFAQQHVVGVRQFHKGHRRGETEYFFHQENQHIGESQETGIEGKFQEIVPIIVGLIGEKAPHFGKTRKVFVDGSH